MASGCIMGNCPYCDELIWEDSWTLNAKDQIVHPSCRARRAIHISGYVTSRSTYNGVTTITIREDKPQGV